MTLLMRTADKTGAFGLVRATARAQRRAAAAEGRSAHALFASAYVFAKYYWPQRALPLLERARQQAEIEQNWELEHSCRDGIGVVLRQLGRYAEAIEQTGFGLALARRTLNPQAEATSLVNIAVAQIAAGQFQSAAHQLELSANIDRQFPRWPYRVYRYSNQGVLALLWQGPDEARAPFERGLELATSTHLGPIAATCCAGLALCALRAGRLQELRNHCSRLASIVAGQRATFGDRWMVEAAFGWNEILNSGGGSDALRTLDQTCAELNRRDIDHWLRLQAEAIRVSEWLKGEPDWERRRKVATLGKKYGATAIVAEADRAWNANQVETYLATASLSGLGDLSPLANTSRPLGAASME